MNTKWVMMAKAVGIFVLLLLAFIYRGGEDGAIHYFAPQWWGILGLIGWAYLYSCIIYQLFKGNILLIIFIIAVCMGIFIASHTDSVKDIAWLQWAYAQSGNAICYRY